jgi:hypothetical protein
VCNALAWLRYSSWIVKCVAQSPLFAAFPSFFALLLCRDLRAWMESCADLDAILEVDGYRQVLISQIKRIDDECKLAMSTCESPSQVVVRGSISTYFTRLGWFNPEKHGPFTSIRSMITGISRMLVSLKPLAIALYTALESPTDAAHLDALKERVTKFESLCHAMNIYHRLVSSQYPSGREGEVLPRTSELALLAALDRMLGVSSLMNCKSGCDRAGLVSALLSARRSSTFVLTRSRRTVSPWRSSPCIARTPRQL